MSKPTYCIQLESKAFCAHCHKPVYLLAKYWSIRRATMFYICFDCNAVYEVGKGEVPRV